MLHSQSLSHLLQEKLIESDHGVACRRRRRRRRRCRRRWEAIAPKIDDSFLPFNYVGTYQCDQIGQFLHFGQSFKVGGNNYFTQITHIVMRFIVKVLKSFIFLVESFLGNFFKHWAIFIWSHWHLSQFRRRWLGKKHLTKKLSLSLFTWYCSTRALRKIYQFIWRTGQVSDSTLKLFFENFFYTLRPKCSILFCAKRRQRDPLTGSTLHSTKTKPPLFLLTFADSVARWLK